ncbi:craniofacial development protein 2-like [Penaeus vannamei]|uniref:craniofacial development protein 2-like n=1 Tax=Penaeus vannamei TaxID=6689 RepID=UPI00387F658B
MPTDSNHPPRASCTRGKTLLSSQPSAKFMTASSRHSGPLPVAPMMACEEAWQRHDLRKWLYLLLVGRSDDHHLQGVAIDISSRLQPSVVKVTPVDERLMVLRLKLSFSFTSLIAVYAPTDVCKLDMKENFYIKLTSVVDKCPRRFVLGDFNEVSGCDRAGYEMPVSPYGSGADAGRQNSLLFPGRSQKLRFSGSWYQRPDSHRWAWYSDAGNAAKEIDHILVSTRWRILQNCRVYRSAEFCATDHRLVVATLWVRFKTPQCLTDPVLLWDTFKHETLDAAQDTIDVRPRAVQNSISQETLEAKDACSAARLTGDRDLSLLRRDKEQFIRTDLDAGSVEIPLPDPPISEDHPPLTEVRG